MTIKEYDEISSIENIFTFKISDIEFLREIHRPNNDEFEITFKSGKILYGISKENFLKVKKQYNLYIGD